MARATLTGKIPTEIIETLCADITNAINHRNSTGSVIIHEINLKNTSTTNSKLKIPKKFT